MPGRLRGHIDQDWVEIMEWTADGRHLRSCDYSGTECLWEVEEGRLLSQAEGDRFSSTSFLIGEYCMSPLGAEIGIIPQNGEKPIAWLPVSGDAVISSSHDGRTWAIAAGSEVFFYTLEYIQD